MTNTVIRFIWEKPWLLLIIVVALSLFTGQKLLKMTQIRGWIPGGQVLEKVVTEKDFGKSVGRRRADTSFWIAWDGQSAREVGNNRTNLSEDDWLQVDVGDTIQLVKVPFDNRYYLRDGIYDSIGNFGFDIFLFIAEITLFIIALTKVLKPKRTSVTPAIS